MEGARGRRPEYRTSPFFFFCPVKPSRSGRAGSHTAGVAPSRHCVCPLFRAKETRQRMKMAANSVQSRDRVRDGRGWFLGRRHVAGQFHPMPYWGLPVGSTGPRNAMQKKKDKHHPRELSRKRPTCLNGWVEAPSDHHLRAPARGIMPARQPFLVAVFGFTEHVSE